jgi:peptidoglycan L-alanyl-D-glutamate endopeptidase CwlK
MPLRSLYPDLESAIEGTGAPAEIVSQLELVSVDYLNFDFAHVSGQLVVAGVLAEEVQEIFGSIRDDKLPIFSVIPIALFDHDDHRSIAANNTSAFNYRVVAGTDHLSKHSFGRAIDINPLLNPCMNVDGSPRAESFPYPGYEPSTPGTVVENGAVVKAFTDHGWKWGGQMKKITDYQHFHKK